MNFAKQDKFANFSQKVIFGKVLFYFFGLLVFVYSGFCFRPSDPSFWRVRVGDHIYALVDPGALRWLVLLVLRTECLDLNNNELSSKKNSESVQVQDCKDFMLSGAAEKGRCIF